MHSHPDCTTSVCHRPCLGRHRRFDHEHRADDADQRIARAASDHRPPLRRRPARRGRAGDSSERVDIAGAGAGGDLFEWSQQALTYA
jgi:hypothetical protein